MKEQKLQLTQQKYKKKHKRWLQTVIRQQIGVKK